MTKTFAKLARQTHNGGPSTLCRSCLSQLRQIQSRHAATAASSNLNISVGTSPIGHAPSAPTAPESYSVAYKIRASVLLSRPPLLTRDLTPFEKSFFLYQRRLNERLALPFTRYFYYQKGTPGDVEWKRKIKERLTPARDIGKFTGYSKEAWNDELLVGDKLSEPQTQTEALIRDAEDKEDTRGVDSDRKEEDVMVRPTPRVTEADKANDLRSLNRLLTRTLYLLVKPNGKEAAKEHWMLPGSGPLENESLRSAAEKIVSQTCGTNVNTWVVGNLPAGHQVFNYPNSIINKQSDKENRGEKIFYMRARIMAGQVDLRRNSLGLGDFQWLTKEEMQEALTPRDYAAVKNLLADR